MKHTTIILAFIFSFLSCKPEADFSNPPVIESINFTENNTWVGTIKENEILVVLPYQTNLKNLTPNIKFSSNAQLIPASGVSQDFSKPVYYTLIAENGHKVIYKVTISTEPQPAPTLASISKDTLEAGLDLEIKGKDFGNFPPDVSVNLIASTNEATLIPHKLIDSSKIIISTPINLKIGDYKIKVSIKKLEVIYNKTLNISYPSPRILETSKNNILSNDTLWLKAEYIATSYKYAALFKNTKGTFQIPSSNRKSDMLGFIPNDLEGDFSVFIKNTSENKISRTENITVKIFDAQKPYVGSIISTKASFKKSESLVFSTINFESKPYRFYQVNIFNSEQTFVLNGVYENNKLTVTLPSNIRDGKYSLSFLLTNPTLNLSYSLYTDLELLINSL